MGEEEDGTLRRDKIIGNYEGAFVCWGRDVWTGNHDDCARLYNPTQEEVARIEISPDMVDKSASKHGCLMMSECDIYFTKNIRENERIYHHFWGLSLDIFLFYKSIGDVSLFNLFFPFVVVVLHIISH